MRGCVAPLSTWINAQWVGLSQTTLVYCAFAHHAALSPDMTGCEMQVVVANSTHLLFGAARRMEAVVRKVRSVAVACANRAFALR